MKKYSKYKDARIKWIGEIPEHWSLTKIKNETALIVDGTHFTPMYIENGVPFLRVTDIQSNEIDLNNVKHISEFEHFQLCKRCKPQKGDLLLSKNGTIGLTKIIDWNWEFSIFVSLCLIRFKSEFTPQLFSYLFQSSIVDQQLSDSSKQSTVTNLHLDKIRELTIIKPPLSEQSQIVSFLDQKTSIIDDLIQKKLQKIELLKEQRTSIINQAVTKGLNFEVRMKDSGVEWIGEIPEHWEVTKIRRYCEVKDGTHDTPEYIDSSENSIPLVTSNSFVEGEIDFAKTKHISQSDYLDINKRSNVQLNDIIMSMIGGNIGNRVLIKASIPFSIKNVCLFKTSQSKRLYPNYLLYLIDSKYLRQQIDFNEKGGGQPFLSLDELRNLIFPFPSLDEQSKIVHYLDKKTTEIDKQVDLENRKIDLLKEYRQSLISEVVTGKIDVRTN